MIKFFRKIRQNLLIENKTGKYFKYAIGEIALVVIGILIALSLNNWNSNRIQKLKEGKFLKQIHKEFLLNKVQLKSVTSNHFKAHNSATKIEDLMPIEISAFNKDSLSSYIWGTFLNSTFNPQQSAVNSLTNTSSFEIISNIELRKLLENWDDIVTDYKEEEVTSKAFFYNSYLPYFSKKISISNPNVFDHSNINFTFLNSLEFENLITSRRILFSGFIEDDVNSSSEKTELEEISLIIDRIIELTTPEK